MLCMICQNCWEDLIKKRNRYLNDFDWHWQHLNQMICLFSERRSSFWSGCVITGKGIEIQRMYGLCLRPASAAVTWRNWTVLTSDHPSNVPYLRLALKYIWSYVHITWTQLYYVLNTVMTTYQFLSVYSTDWTYSGRLCQSSAEASKWILMKVNIQVYSRSYTNILLVCFGLV
jgi:hypothetical protein